MRLISTTRLLLLGLAALAATAGSARAADLPDSGFIVYKDTLRGSAVTQVRDDATGRVVMTLRAARAKPAPGSECADPHFDTFARWRGIPAYRINAASIPSYLDAGLARSQLVAAQRAWQGRFVTDCAVPNPANSYRANDAGNTSSNPTLVTDLVGDGQNTVGWVSLAGTVCDGALACVVADFSKGRINEADLALESDLTRYGYEDFWTTSGTTFTTSTGGEFAISDVGTHEFGHFAGLDHVERSPELTMYPFIHDGDDTLGRGDMMGLLSLY
jgi:hypothetical protein